MVVVGAAEDVVGGGMVEVGKLEEVTDGNGLETTFITGVDRLADAEQISNILLPKILILPQISKPLKIHLAALTISTVRYY